MAASAAEGGRGIDGGTDSILQCKKTAPTVSNTTRGLKEREERVTQPSGVGARVRGLLRPNQPLPALCPLPSLLDLTLLSDCEVRQRGVELHR